ncbi:MAG: hypothetical protein Q9207_007010 [Kuettlingeria erythrocarpa]
MAQRMEDQDTAADGQKVGDHEMAGGVEVVRALAVFLGRWHHKHRDGKPCKSKAGPEEKSDKAEEPSLAVQRTDPLNVSHRCNRCLKSQWETDVLLEIAEEGPERKGRKQESQDLAKAPGILVGEVGLPPMLKQSEGPPYQRCRKPEHLPEHGVCNLEHSFKNRDADE